MNRKIQNFIIKICTEILEGEYSEESIKNYLLSTNIAEIEYTGSGCFINLNSKNSKIELEPINSVYNQSDLYFDGLELENVDENLLCDISVRIVQSKIDTIELWNKLGTNFETIPEYYTLKKCWK